MQNSCKSPSTSPSCHSVFKLSSRMPSPWSELQNEHPIYFCSNSPWKDWRPKSSQLDSRLSTPSTHYFYCSLRLHYISFYCQPHHPEDLCSTVYLFICFSLRAAVKSHFPTHPRARKTWWGAFSGVSTASLARLPCFRAWPCHFPAVHLTLSVSQFPHP